MTSAEAVGQVKAIVEGGKAMATLHIQNDPQAKKLIDALEVKAEDKTLSLRWRAPANDVWDAMQKCIKKMGEKGPELKERLKKQHEAARKSHEKPSN